MVMPPDDPLAEARLVPVAPRLGPPRLARPVRIDPTGVNGPTRHQARASRWRSLGRGWVVPAEVEVDQPAQHIVEAAVGLQPGEAVTGWASLHLARARYVTDTTPGGRPLPIRLLVRSARRDPAGVVTSRAAVAPEEILLRHGVPCTNVHRALLDELCALSELSGASPDDRLRWAVVLIDMVLFAELTSRQRFAGYLATVPRRRGLQLARAALARAVEGSESPRETLMRLVWELDAHLPAPRCNQPICGRNGTFLARPDLLVPELGVAGEYDGLHHQETGRRSEDIAREGELRNHGLEVFSFVAGELNDRASAVLRMHDAVRRAQEASRSQAWSLMPISWTLEERLVLRELLVELTRGGDALARLRRDTPSAAGPPATAVVRAA